MADEGQSRGSSWARWTGAVEPDEQEHAHEQVDEMERLYDEAGRLAEPAGDVDVRLDWPVERPEEEATARDRRPFPDDGLPSDEALVTAADEAAEEQRAHARRVTDRGVTGGTELLRSAPLLPAIAGRVDALDGQLRALGMRLDLLASSVGSLRGAIGDRIDGYAETANVTARRADQALDDHRRATERGMLELRRSLAGTDEVLRNVAGRLDEIATDVATLLGAETRPAPSPTAPATAAGSIGDQLATVLDVLSYVEERVTGLDGRVAALDERLSSSAEGEPATAEGDEPWEEERLVDVDLAPVLDAIAALDERLAALPADATASPEIDLSPVLDAIASLDARLGGRLAALPADATASPEIDLSPVLDAIASLDARLGEPAGSAAAAPVNPAVVLDAIASLDDRLADLADVSARSPAELPAPDVSLDAVEQGLAEVRSLVEVVVDTMPASNEGSGADIADRVADAVASRLDADRLAVRVADAVLARLDVDELARQVADRLEQRFEVVVEPGE